MRMKAADFHKKDADLYATLLGELAGDLVTFQTGAFHADIKLKHMLQVKAAIEKSNRAIAKAGLKQVNRVGPVYNPSLTFVGRPARAVYNALAELRRNNGHTGAMKKGSVHTDYPIDVFNARFSMENVDGIVFANGVVEVVASRCHVNILKEFTVDGVKCNSDSLEEALGFTFEESFYEAEVEIVEGELEKAPQKTRGKGKDKSHKK